MVIYPEMFYDSRDAHQLDEIMDRAVQLINPIDKKRSQCREFVSIGIFVVRLLARWNASQNREKLVLTFDRLVRTLETALNTYYDFVNTFGFSRFIVKNLKAPSENAFHKLPKVIEAVLNGRIKYSPKQGPVADGAKRIAALYSLVLIEDFAEKRVTKTVGGLFYELASVLYEGATYSANANLERHCRAAFKIYEKAKASNVDLRKFAMMAFADAIR